MKFDQARWHQELEAGKKIGLDTIVIQWLKSDQTEFFPKSATGVDPTETILAFADQNQMKVFIGLIFERSWWKTYDKKDALQQLAKSTLEYGKTALSRYGKHPSFVGWYIPYETNDLHIKEEGVQGIQDFLKSIATGLRALSNKKVAFSAFFSGKLPPAELQKTYTRVLSNSGVDIVMVQDGVGVRNWDLESGDQVTPYLQAFAAATRAAGVSFWSVVENFSVKRGPTDERNPADMSRIAKQIKIHSAQPVEKIVVFDFFHYMSPYRGEAQKALYQKFMQLQ